MTETHGEVDDEARIARLERRLSASGPPVRRLNGSPSEACATSGRRTANWRIASPQRTAELSQSLAAATMAMQAKERFLAELGHELTTPLHAVLGLLELTDPATLDETNRSNLAAVRTHSMQLAELLHALVELAGAEGAPIPTSFLEQRPLDWLDGAVSDWTKRAAARGQLLVPSTSGRSTATLADWPRLRRMLDAAMSNTTEHASPGAIGISLDVTSDRVVVTVTDSGPGMTPDEAATALEPFVSHGRSAGVGIGLAIADRLARAAGGAVELTSAASGTTVAMTLPRP